MQNTPFVCVLIKVLFIFQDTWETTDTYDIDHCYLSTPETDKFIILYGQIGTPAFIDFHEKLKNIADTKGINYILRHYVKVIIYMYLIQSSTHEILVTISNKNDILQERADKKLRLSGYGVELQMKSTEYKATDDSDIKDNTGKNSEVTNDGVEEIEGINFMTLK